MSYIIAYTPTLTLNMDIKTLGGKEATLTYNSRIQCIELAIKKCSYEVYSIPLSIQFTVLFESE